MEEILLEAEIRSEIGRGKINDIRDKGFIPAVVYSGGKESQPVKFLRGTFIKLMHQHRLESAIVTLKVKDDKKAKSRACLIKEIQYDPVKGDVLHVDLNEISLTKALKVNVPVVPKGESVGVKMEGGSLEHILWEVEVECLPTDIPKQIEVEVGHLKMKDAVHVRDLVVSDKVKILNDPNALVLSIAEPIKEEAPAEAVEGEEKQEPEVIKEKKEVPEEGKKEEKEEKKK